MAVVTITTAAGTVSIVTVSAVTVNVDGVTVTFTPAPAPAVEEPTAAPAAEEPVVEEPVVDDVEHWFCYGCGCEWCERMRDALDNFVNNSPWSCPRCESINHGSAVCEVCDTDIRVDRTK